MHAVAQLPAPAQLIFSYLSSSILILSLGGFLIKESPSLAGGH